MKRRRVNTINVTIVVVKIQARKTLALAKDEVGGPGEVKVMVEHNGTRAT